MADLKIKLTKADRFRAFLRSYFSFIHERMQMVVWLTPLFLAPKTLSTKKTVLLVLNVTWNSLIHNLSWLTQSLGLYLP